MIVIKYGGHALPKDGGFDPSLAVIAAEHKHGREIVLVHGGGPHINDELELHGITPTMVNGLRKTTPEVLAVVQKVLSGEILRNIVNQLIGLGVNAIGVSSGDGKLIRAEVKNSQLGLVGDITEVNPEILLQLIASGYLPVISPIGVSVKGQGLNLNADLVAGEIAGALRAKKILFMTDVAGIYRNWPDQISLIKEIALKELQEIAEDFSEGMAPKVKSLIVAVERGAESAFVFDGRSAENLAKAINGEFGTKVYQ